MQSLHQCRRDADYGDLRYVIKKDAHLIADRAHQLREVGVQTVLGDRFVIKRRQRHNGGTTKIQAGAGQARCVGDIREPRPGDHARRIDTCVNECGDCRDALVDTHRQRLASGAKWCDTGTTLFEQPASMSSVQIESE